MSGVRIAALGLMLGLCGLGAWIYHGRLVDRPAEDTQPPAATSAPLAPPEPRTELERLIDDLPRDSPEAPDSQTAARLRELGPSAVPALIDALTSDRRPRVRAWAAVLLADHVGEAEVLDALLGATTDAETPVRLYALRALEGRTPPPENELTAQRIVDAYLARLEDDEPLVRERSAAGLGRIGERDGRHFPELARLLDDPEDSVKLVAIETLGRIGKPARSAVPRLAELARHPRLAPEAIRALLGIREPADLVIPALIGALSSPTRHVAGEAEQALRTILRDKPDLLTYRQIREALEGR